MKRLIAIAGAGAMLLSVVTPVFADNNNNHPSSGVTNNAVINSTVITSAKTGDINQTVVGGSVEKAKNFSMTGDATSIATVGTIANTNVTIGCSSCETGNVTNNALINTTVRTKAATGDVTQTIVGGGRHNEVEGVKNISLTGAAGAQADVWTVANTNVSWSFGGFR